MSSKKHFLLITADQWRGDCLSAAGHPVVKTPHLDSLAAEGVRFNQHYAGATPCSPARACMYTGLYQMNNRVCVNGSPLDKRHDTLALAFRRLGYDPTMFGYTDQAPDPRGLPSLDPVLTTYEGLLPGFNWRASLPDHQRPWLSWLEQQGYEGALANKSMHTPLSGVDDPPKSAVPQYRAEHTETAYMVNEFDRWLSEQTHAMANDDDHRWFAHVSFVRPHPPFTVPEPYNTLFSPADVPAFAGGGDWKKTSESHPYLKYAFSVLPKTQFIPGTQGMISDWNTEDLRNIAACYYGMIAEVDAQLGRLFEGLKRRGFWDNTVVVFTSDHGEMLGDHGLLGKQGFYDQSYHVPLIIKAPNQKRRGTVVDNLTESVDLMPTLLNLADSTLPPHLDGHSVVPFLQGDAPHDWRTAAHWEFDFRNIDTRLAEQSLALSSSQCNLCVYRTDAYKYVHFGGLPNMLFDLNSDPTECENVIDHPDYQSVRVTCAEGMLSWRAEHLDQSLSFSTITDRGVVHL